MKEIKITESKIKEALAQIDTIGELGPKERGCLRLLTEEMFSMCHELLGTYALDFEIKHSGRQYTLSGITKARVNETARAQFLSSSSSGKNAANKGVKGLLGAVLEMFSMEGDPELYNTSLAYGMHGSEDIYRCTWTLSRYIDALEERATAPQWDGLEKSIIANFADDISIGVRNSKLEMTITKTF